MKQKNNCIVLLFILMLPKDVQDRWYAFAMEPYRILLHISFFLAMVLSFYTDLNLLISVKSFAHTGRFKTYMSWIVSIIWLYCWEMPSSQHSWVRFYYPSFLKFSSFLHLHEMNVCRQNLWLLWQISALFTATNSLLIFDVD